MQKKNTYKLYLGIFLGAYIIISILYIGRDNKTHYYVTIKKKNKIWCEYCVTHKKSNMKYLVPFYEC